MERRGRVPESRSTWVNWQQEEPDGLGGRRRPSTGGTSCVTGDGQARICERLGVKFPGPTRQQVTELRQTGLRRVMRKHPNSHREATATAPVLDSTRLSTHRPVAGLRAHSRQISDFREPVRWRDGKYVYYLRPGQEPAVSRVRLANGKVEEVASLKDMRQTGFRGGIWMGLAPDDSPAGAA